MNRDLVIRFASLLRNDVHDQLAAWGLEGADFFECWWAVWGRHEYPKWAVLSESQRQRLFAPLANVPFFGALGYNRILEFIVHTRSDLKTAFAAQSAQASWLPVAWFYSKGIVEYQLLDLLTQDVINSLHSTSPKLWGPKSSKSSSKISFLMYFAWLTHPQLQTQHPLQTPKEEKAFAGWFAKYGVKALGLERLYPASKPATSPSSKVASPIRRVNKNFGVNLIGYAKAEMGIGEDIRMAAAACDAANIPYRIINVSPQNGSRQLDHTLDSKMKTGSRAEDYRINIFCVTAFDTARLFLEFGVDLFEDHYNIGWWPWELPVWPRRWDIAFLLCNEIWAATSFTQKTYASATKLPVVKMPLAVCVDGLIRQKRATFGIPLKSYMFLFVFDQNSYRERKNPKAIVDAFQKAFSKKDRDVHLVFKVMNSSSEDPDWIEFQRVCRNDTRITIVDRTLNRGELLGLIECCDALISLHRAEGFGRTLAEAMLLGKPVIATDFSGSRDFIKTQDNFPVEWKPVRVQKGQYPFVEDLDNPWWADPSIENAAEKMLIVRHRLTTAQLIKKNRKTKNKNLFAPLFIGSKMRKRLVDLST